MKIKIKNLIISILIPLIVGGLSSLLTGSSISSYKALNKPVLSPPSILFPIVWTILFILMGIGFYLIINEKNNDKAIRLYFIQLIFNFFWTIIFFKWKLRLLAVIWIIILVILIINMIKEFYKLNKTSAYLQIPYLVWTIFATYLTIGIYILNK